MVQYATGGLALFLCHAKKLVEATANEDNPVKKNPNFKSFPYQWEEVRPHPMPAARADSRARAP